MGLFSRTTKLSDDTVRHLKGQRGALLSTADQLRTEARQAPTATGRARLIGKAKAAKSEADQIGRQIRRSR